MRNDSVSYPFGSKLLSHGVDDLSVNKPDLVERTAANLDDNRLRPDRQLEHVEGVNHHVPQSAAVDSIALASPRHYAVVYIWTANPRFSLRYLGSEGLELRRCKSECLSQGKWRWWWPEREVSCRPSYHVYLFC